MITKKLKLFKIIFCCDEGNKYGKEMTIPNQKISGSVNDNAILIIYNKMKLSVL